MALNNIRRHGIKPGKIIKVVLNMISDDHVLHIEHLGSSNFGYVNDAVRGAGSDEIKAIVGGGAKTPEQRQRIRDANRETVSKHSVRGHDGFLYDDVNGEPDPAKPVKQDAAGIAEVVNALPDDIFDIVLAIAVNQENFRDVVAAAKPDDLAKK